MQTEQMQNSLHHRDAVYMRNGGNSWVVDGAVKWDFVLTKLMLHLWRDVHEPLHHASVNTSLFFKAHSRSSWRNSLALPTHIRLR